MNRRNWLKHTGLSAPTIAFAPFIPHVLYSERAHVSSDKAILRLNWNENAYGPSPKALLEAGKKFNEANLYPDDQIQVLINSIQERYDLLEGQVLLTAGSTELLSLLGQDVGMRKGEILMSELSFPTIAIFGERCGAKIKTIPINENLQIDLDLMANALSPQTKLIFLCNPNNPTSTDHQKEDLISFCASIPDEVTVCIDEAYIQYSRDGEKGSMIDLLSSFSNVIILRTFSKAYGLAGMRQGYAVGQKALIDRIQKMHLGFGFSNSRIGVITAIEALKDEDHIDMVVSKNEQGRSILYDAFDHWQVAYAPSATNFVYLESSRFPSNIVDKLKSDNILITQWPSMTGHIRVSIGKTEWMEQFVDVAQKYLI